jgi:hypothetical protein
LIEPNLKKGTFKRALNIENGNILLQNELSINLLNKLENGQFNENLI